MKHWTFTWTRFGEDVSQARKRRGETQAELAARVGVTRFAVAAWESGRVAPSVEKLCQICTAAGLDPRQYFRRQR